MPVYVAETDEIAIREATPHIEALFNNYLHMPLEMVLPPGYTSIASMKAILATKKGMTTVKQTMTDILEKVTFIVGSPAETWGVRLLTPLNQCAPLTFTVELDGKPVKSGVALDDDVDLRRVRGLGAAPSHRDARIHHAATPAQDLVLVAEGQVAVRLALGQVQVQERLVVPC